MPEICRSAIGQASQLICARRSALSTDVPVLLLNQPNNGNRTEWSPTCLITVWLYYTDQTGRHEVLLPISHNYNKICDILSFFKFKVARSYLYVII